MRRQFGDSLGAPNRRSFLATIIALGVVPLAPKWLLATASALERQKAQIIIDVHCHIFNVKDLPSKEFLRTVIQKKYPDEVIPNPASAPSKKRAWSLTDLFIDTQVSEAPSPATEIACLSKVLNDDHCSAYENTFNSGSLIGLFNKRSKDLYSNLLSDYKMLLNDKPRQRYFKDSEWLNRKEEVSEVLQSSFGGKGRLAELLKKENIKQLSGHLRSSQRNLSFKLQWPNILKKYRFQIVETYKSSYDKSKNRKARKIALIAPALVDMSCWLKKSCQTDWWPKGQSNQIKYLRQQTHLMNLISQTSKSVRVQGYVAFDPLRQIYAEQKKLDFTPLMVVQEAIQTHGCVGVKLYPPMGFRPVENGKPGTAFPKFTVDQIQSFGDKLDDALSRLYQWCSANGVAIMAHGYHSNEAGPSYGCRASPTLWKKVLANNPTLHLNLAHFGRFDKSINCSKGESVAGSLEETWEWEIGRIIKSSSGKHLYADLSYFDTLLEGSWDNDQETKRVATALRKWIETFDPGCQHLLFGTDWSMIALEGDYHSYIDNFELFLIDDVGLNSTQLGNFFYNNAVKFLGLATGDKARGRLNKFYRSSKKLKPGYLSKFDYEIDWG